MRYAAALLAVLVTSASCGKHLSTDPAGDSLLASDGAWNDPESTSRPFTVRLKVVGTVVILDRDFTPRVHRNHSFYVTSPGPLDTVPAFGVLESIQWRPTAGIGPSPVDEPIHARAAGDASSAAIPEVAEPGQVFAPGLHELTLEAPAHAGGGEVTVQLMAGFIPSTWWAGPDPDLWPASSDGDGRAVDVVNWSSFTTVPAWPPDGRPYFGPDSLDHIPSVRRPPGDDFERRTFYELYGDRIYARREGDAVHQGSWVVLVNGGCDKDSPYVPRVDPSDPGLPADFSAGSGRYPVLQSLGLVGSPIGFRNQLTVRLPDGEVLRLPQSGLYPVFDPLSPFRLPVVAGYLQASIPGRAYVVARAQDSDGLLDAAVLDPIGVVARVDAGGGTPEERLARRRIIVFDVEPAATL